MAIKTNSQQTSQQDQAERPPVLGPLVAGVVVIKVFAAIKGEQAIGAPEFDWIAEEPQGGAPRGAGLGLSIPPAMAPPANSNSGAPYARPLAYQADEAPAGDDAWEEEVGPQDTASDRSQGRTGDDGFQPADGPSAPVQAPDAPVAVRAASEPAGVPASGGGPSANGAGGSASGAPAERGNEGAVPGEDSGQDGPAEDAPGDTRSGDAPGDDPPEPVVFGTDPADGPTRSWGGDPLMQGGGGDDTLLGGTGDDIIRGLGGDDTLDGRGGDDSLYGGSDDDRLLGGDGDDRLDGGGGDDQLSGGAGDDNLDGGAGADRLFGLDGDDQLIGGLGWDELSGGGGADRFVLNEVAESFTENPDQLLDFRAYERDKLDVSGIDANSQTAQDEAFAFIENDPFSGSAGELRFTESHGATYLYGDVNGDGEADFALELLGVSSLSVDDLIL